MDSPYVGHSLACHRSSITLHKIRVLSLTVILLGLFWLIKGLYTIISIFIDSSAWGRKLFIGLLGIAAGIIVIQHRPWGSFVLPAVAAIILGIYGLIVGVVSIILAFKGGGWGAGILGVLSIVIGLLLLFNALVAGQILVIFLGIFMAIAGRCGDCLGIPHALILSYDHSI